MELSSIPWGHLEQALICASGAAAIWLVNDPRPSRRRWAPPIGLMGQPAWLHTAWESGQWGVLVITVVFTLAWVRGLIHHTIRGGSSPPTTTSAR